MDLLKVIDGGECAKSRNNPCIRGGASSHCPRLRMGTGRRCLHCLGKGSGTATGTSPPRSGWGQCEIRLIMGHFARKNRTSARARAKVYPQKNRWRGPISRTSPVPAGPAGVRTGFPSVGGAPGMGTKAGRLTRPGRLPTGTMAGKSTPSQRLRRIHASGRPRMTRAETRRRRERKGLSISDLKSPQRGAPIRASASLRAISTAWSRQSRHRGGPQVRSTDSEVVMPGSRGSG